MKDKHAKAVISICELEHPIQFCNKLGSNGSMEDFIDPENIQRTQDLENYYRLNGAIYYFDRSYVEHLDQLYSEGTYAYIMESKDSIDIDTEDDFRLTEYLIHKNKIKIFLSS